MSTCRLDALLSQLGVASRSQAKDIIRQGRVKVGGAVVSVPEQRVSPGASLEVDGRAVDSRTQRHVLMNKPAGVLTAANDRAQATVMDLLPPVYRALGCMPVGRLDKDTQGLLLFTTDGQLAHRLLAPRSGVEKEYFAKVSGMLNAKDVARFAQGLQLSDFEALPAQLIILNAGGQESQALVTVSEGKFHQIKRMFSACGHEVLYLERRRFGPFVLEPGLTPGMFRELRPQEEAQLMQAGYGHG